MTSGEQGPSNDNLVMPFPCDESRKGKRQNVLFVILKSRMEVKVDSVQSSSITVSDKEDDIPEKRAFDDESDFNFIALRHFVVHLDFGTGNNDCSSRSPTLPQLLSSVGNIRRRRSVVIPGSPCILVCSMNSRPAVVEQLNVNN